MRARDLLSQGLTLQRDGRHAEAARLYLQVLERDPRDAEALQLLGLALFRLGQADRALDLLTRAVSADPRHAPAHANRAMVLAALHRPGDAENALRTALTVRPDFPEAAARLGGLLLARGAAPEAEAAFRRARPTPAVLADLGAALALQDRLDEAVSTWREALRLDPALPLHARLAAACHTLAARVATPDEALPLLRDAVLAAPDVLAYAITLTDTLAQVPRPPPMREALAALLGHDDLDAQRFAHALRDTVEGPADPLFAAMLTRTIVADPAWEARLVALRRTLCEGGDDTVREAVAIQAWLTEYAWACDPDEPAGLTGLAAAMYGPVPATPRLAALLTPDDPDGIPTLGLTEDAVSLAVRAQYEENPYPRLVPVHRASGTLPQVPFPDPKVLVAGCGTGQHPLSIAVRYPDADILAVDLSRASLARARRVARAHGIGNLRFAQADLVALPDLPDRFDWIDCVGVLHHLADPLAGLRGLVRCLRPDGRLRLGLYSERGRAEVVDARVRVAHLPPTPDGLRAARVLLRDHPVARSVDFYSLSGCRDLVFHAQEHRFTPLQVRDLLDAAALVCLGLQHPRPEPARRYRERWPDDPSQADLSRWEELEEEHPRIFSGMIQVWARRQA